MAMTLRGWSKAVIGHVEDGIAEIEDGIALETIMQAASAAPPAMPASMISTKIGTSPLSVDQVFSQEISHG